MVTSENFAEASAHNQLAIAAQERVIRWSKIGEAAGLLVGAAGVILDNLPTTVVGAVGLALSVGSHIAGHAEIMDLRGDFSQQVKNAATNPAQ